MVRKGSPVRVRQRAYPSIPPYRAESGCCGGVLRRGRVSNRVHRGGAAVARVGCQGSRFSSRARRRTPSRCSYHAKGAARVPVAHRKNFTGGGRTPQRETNRIHRPAVDWRGANLPRWSGVAPLASSGTRLGVSLWRHVGSHAARVVPRRSSALRAVELHAACARYSAPAQPSLTVTASVLVRTSALRPRWCRA
jgi:hypothetical protein